MNRQLTPFFTKILLPFFLVSTLSLPYRCSEDSSTETARTLAIIKPDGVSGNHTNSVRETILNHGFKITEESFIQLDEDRVKSFYAEHSSRSFFPSLVEYMTSGPVLIMVLEKGNAIADWRALIGPTDPLKAKVTHPHSVRAMCGLNLQKNCVHGSDSPQSAAREISFFFKRTSSEKRSDDNWFSLAITCVMIIGFAGCDMLVSNHYFLLSRLIYLCVKYY